MNVWQVFPETLDKIPFTSPAVRETDDSICLCCKIVFPGFSSAFYYLASSYLLMNCEFVDLIQVLCAYYSDEEFLQIRCKGNLLWISLFVQRPLHLWVPGERNMTKRVLPWISIILVFSCAVFF